MSAAGPPGPRARGPPRPPRDRSHLDLAGRSTRSSSSNRGRPMESPASSHRRTPGRRARSRLAPPSRFVGSRTPCRSLLTSPKFTPSPAASLLLHRAAAYPAFARENEDDQRQDPLSPRVDRSSRLAKHSPCPTSWTAAPQGPAHLPGPRSQPAQLLPKPWLAIFGIVAIVRIRSTTRVRLLHGLDLLSSGISDAGTGNATT